MYENQKRKNGPPASPAGRSSFYNRPLWYVQIRCTGADTNWRLPAQNGEDIPNIPRGVNQMSLYGSKIQIDGVSCGLVMRGSSNGQYLVVFERELATLEQVEAINWEQPSIEGDCILPVGYGFTVSDIRYSAATRSYTVVLQVGEQYLGDVTGYQSQVAELESTVARQQEEIRQKDDTIAQLESEGSQALKEELEAAYEEGVESNG